MQVPGPHFSAKFVSFQKFTAASKFVNACVLSHNSLQVNCRKVKFEYVVTFYGSPYIASSPLFYICLPQIYHIDHHTLAAPFIGSLTNTTLKQVFC